MSLLVAVEVVTFHVFVTMDMSQVRGDRLRWRLARLRILGDSG